MQGSELKDSLGECLLWLAKEEGETTTRAALLAGLPLPEGILTPSTFAQAAQRVHFSTSVERQSLAQINGLLLPCILILEGRRACLLLSVDRQQQEYRLLFPSQGNLTRSLEAEALEACFQGTVIYCQRQFKLDADIQQPPAEPERGHWFWSVIREHRPVYRDVLLAALFVNLFALAMPLFVMNVYDRVVPNHATDTLWVLALGVVLLVVAELCLRLLRSWFVDLAANRADIKLSAKIMARIQGTRLESRPASIGAFAANVQAFEGVRGFIGSATVTALIDLPFFLLFVLIIGLIAWPLVIPVLVGAVLIVAYALAVQGRMQRLSETINQAGAQRNAGLIESLAVAETLRSFNATSRSQVAWEQATRFLAAGSAKLRLLGTSVGSGAAWVQQLVGVSLMIAGVYLVIAGEMSQGALIAAYMLSSRAMAPVSQSAQLLTQYYHAATALNSLEELMAQPQEREPGKQRVSRPELRGDIEFRDLSFSYPDAQRPALDNVSLSIRAGERVGILGKVGSGKSTLEKLIAGLYQPSAGAVFIDGVHSEQIDPAELRDNLAYIPQDVALIQGTVLDNITLANPRVGRDQLARALQVSGLNSWLGADADGLSMQVGEAGGRLSGGQRQSIAVARAVVQGGKMVLLDEPTSAMDSTLENHVTREIKQFAAGRTLVLVTHRQALLALVDRLIVMDGGRIVADGPKAEVLKALAGGTAVQEAS